MVIKSPPAFVLSLGGCRHAADVTPVVVAEQNRHVVGHSHAGVVVVEHLLVEGPHLWRLAGRAARHLFDYAALVADDLLQQTRIGLGRHRLVAVAAHANGHDVLGVLHPLNAFAEELVEARGVGCVVPGSPLVAVAGIFLVASGHGLVVAGADDNAHLIGQTRVLGVVGIESPVPHRGPHEIAAQTQDEFEHAGVETVVAVVGAVGVFHPLHQAGAFVVEEDASVAHRRLAVGVVARRGKEAVVALHGHVGPPRPWRHASLARQLIEAVDSAAAVAACDHQLLPHGRDEVLLMPSAQRLELRFREQAFQRRTAADGPGHDACVGGRGRK